MSGPEHTDVTGHVLRAIEVIFTAGALAGWTATEVVDRSGHPHWLIPLVLLAGGGLGFWLAGRPRYVRWVFARLVGTDKPDRGEQVEQPDPPDQAPVDDPDIWWTTEDVGDARTPRGVKP